ncbi:hypothetical protein N309_15114, partial [Tinamus guttatus]
VGQSVALVDGHGVGDTIPRVHNNPSGTTRGVQGQHGLDGNVHGWGVEGLEHDLQERMYLCHLLSVGLRVQRSLCEQDRVLLRSHTQLIVEGVMPDFLHVIPVGDNTMLNGVLQGENSSLALGLITHIAVLLSHANHDTLGKKAWALPAYLVPRAPHDGGKHGTGGIIACKASFAH